MTHPRPTGASTRERVCSCTTHAAAVCVLRIKQLASRIYTTMPSNPTPSSKGQTQLSVRTDEELKDQYTDALDEQGKTITEDVREHMRDVVAEYNGETDDGLNDDMAAALDTLRTVADPQTNRVTVDRATTAVAESCRVPKEAVKSSLLKPLEERGYVQPRWGVIRVRPEGEA